MVDVKDITPTNPITPVRRRWHAPDDETAQQQRKKREQSEPPPPPDDGHIDEYV